jgi:hypothetical protein
VWGYIFFGAPLLLGVVLGAFLARGLVSTYALCGLGLLLGFGAVLVVYLTSPPDYVHSNGTDARQFLGRWWEPDFVVILTAIAYVLYLVGLGVGAFVREVVAVLRSDNRIHRSG